MESVGSRIQQALERFGVTSQAGLADAIGVQRVTVNRWIKNGRKPQRRFIKRMARLAGVSGDEMNRYLSYGEQLPKSKVPDPEMLGHFLMLLPEWLEATSFPAELMSYLRDWSSQYRRNPQNVDPEQISGDIRRILNNHQGDREA